ncbi:MAG: hypothetical protein U0T68_05990 [Ferruginibacter sp.]
MKKPISTFVLLICALATLNSCSTSSISKSQRKAEMSNSKENGSYDCFVKMNDGSIVQYKTLKLVTGAFKSPFLLADGKKKIKASQIVAYQNKDHYAVSQKIFYGGKISHVATETLPGFAIRTVKGRLNIYCKKYYNGQVSADEFYLQVGESGWIQPYSAELMNEVLKDNPEAFVFFNNKKFKGHFNDKLLATAQLYNNGQFASIK